VSRMLIPIGLVVFMGVAGPLAAQDKPLIAVIGTGNFAGAFGPALGRAGYPVVYGSRTPEADGVHSLVSRTGSGASATSQQEAAARAQVIVLAVPREALEEVTRSLGNLDGKILVDVSSGLKRIAEDGYLELLPDSAMSERLQARHPSARVVRIKLPSIAFFANPLLAGTPPGVFIAGADPRAREVVAQIIFDTGLDPQDAGPLRFARVFDALGVLTLIPGQQGRHEAFDLKMISSPPLSCFMDMSALFGFGRPYDLDRLPRFPRREPALSCEEWQRRLGW
jgi:8-hydroxy-5-deazaflavin:NADPH oxidoreductase